jgi:hypothetical protein
MSERNGKEFDLDWRPETYWPGRRKRSGTPMNEFARRLERAAATGDFSRLSPPVPFALQGGNFLRKLRHKEVEIARISLDSTTWDVISIRARLTPEGILYNGCDEYEHVFYPKPERSQVPLTLGQLIRLLNGLTKEYDNTGEYRTGPLYLLNCNGKPRNPPEVEEFGSWVTVSSRFYEQLEPYYEWMAERWKKKHLKRLLAQSGESGTNAFDGNGPDRSNGGVNVSCNGHSGGASNCAAAADKAAVAEGGSVSAAGGDR